MKALIQDITSIKTGLFAKPSNIGDLVYLQSKHFDEHGNLCSDLHPELNAKETSENHLLKDGDVLFAAKGNKNFATTYQSHNPPAVASTSFFILRLNDDRVLPQYLSWFLNHPNTQKFIKDCARGTAIPSITKPTLENIQLEIPSIEKQQMVLKIASLAQKEKEIHTQILQKRTLIIEQLLIKIH